MRLSVQIEFDKTMDLVTAKTSVVVGRSPKADLVIPHEGISRQHCRLEFENGKFYITDLGSANGTFVDEKKLPPNVKRHLPNLKFSLGAIDCEVGQGMPSVESKIVSTAVSEKGDHTVTIRLARLDLTEAPRTPEKLELESSKSPLKSKRPRNPVTTRKDEDVEVTSSKLPLYLILGAILLAAAWYFGDK